MSAAPAVAPAHEWAGVEAPPREPSPPSLRQRMVAAAGWSLAGALASRAGVLVAALVTSRLLGSEDFGLVSVAQTSLVVLGSFSGLGLGLTATRFVAERRQAAPAEAGQVVALTTVVSTAAAAVWCAVVLALAGPLSTGLFGDAALEPFLRLGVLLVLFGSVGTTQLGVLSGLEAFRTASVVSVLRGVATAALGILGVVVGGAAGAMVGVAFAELVSCVVAQVLMHRACRRVGITIRLSGASSLRPVLWRFSLPAFSASVAVQVALAAGQILLVRSAGFAAAGVFAVALRWYMVSVFVPSTIGTGHLPILTSLHAGSNVAGYRRALGALFAVTGVFAAGAAVVIAIGSGPILGLHGESFAGGRWVLVVLAAAAVPTAFNTVLGQAAVSAGAVRAWVLSDYLLAGTFLVAGIVLVPAHGAVGLAWAYVAAYTATCLALVRPVARGLQR